MEKKKVLVTDVIDKKGLDILRRETEVVYLPELPGSTILTEIGKVQGIIHRGVLKIDREAIEKGTNLLIIAKHGVGVDGIDVAAATGKGIPVTYTPAANSESVVEHTLGLMLSVCRNICVCDRLLRLGTLKKRENYSGVELQGKTLGVIGLGRIGSELARKCKIAFNMSIICFDPFVTREKLEQFGYQKVEKLGDLLAQSDFVCICIPLTKETNNLVGEKELTLLKSNSFLINSSRGGIVDEKALHRCLQQKKIAGAAFDVFAVEPPPANNPLLSLDNFVATSHVAGLTKEAMVRMATDSAEEILRVFHGERPLYAINPEVWKVR